MSVERLTLALSLVCLAGSSAAATAPAEPTQPFSVQDMVRMERISDVAVAPDGKHVVYTERTTDMEANKGRTSIWMLDTGKRGATPLRLRIGAAYSTPTKLRPSAAGAAVRRLQPQTTSTSKVSR